MKVLIRKTLTGSEYWCTESKRSLFVAAGKKPDFEVTDNPETMIGGVDQGTGKDLTVTIDASEAAAKVSEVIEKAKEELQQNQPEVTWEVNADDIPDTNLDDMNTEQLLSFAKEHDIDVPGNMKKEDTIRNHIADSL